MHIDPWGLFESHEWSCPPAFKDFCSRNLQRIPTKRLCEWSTVWVEVMMMMIMIMMMTMTMMMMLGKLRSRCAPSIPESCITQCIILSRCLSSSSSSSCLYLLLHILCKPYICCRKVNIFYPNPSQEFWLLKKMVADHFVVGQS